MTTNLTLHHTAFNQDFTNGHGSRVIQVTTKDGASFTDKAERAFHDTNAPDATLVEVSREGRCYALSVGDFVEDMATGEIAMVAGCGFTPVTKREFERLVARQAYSLEDRRSYSMDFDGLRSLKRMRAADAIRPVAAAQ